MFINSIFLPKIAPDQTMPEGIAGKIGNFSHLFSNVFRIVKDENTGALPLQLEGLSTEITAETQTQLLNVSLLSESKIVLNNQNISSIISGFLEKLNPKTTTKVLTNNDKTTISENIPKYFSLNKNELIGEIKNIIETLKKGDSKNLEKVEISLIANGQSIQINPLTTNVNEIKNWIGDQLRTKNDFEILVKSGTQKIAVDVEPINTETTKFTNPIQIISETEEAEVEPNTKAVITKNAVDNNTVIKTLSNEQSPSQQPLEALSSTVGNLKPVGEKIENTTTQKQIFNDVKGNIKTDCDSGIKLTTDLNTSGITHSNIKPELVSELKATTIAQSNNELKTVQLKRDKVFEKSIPTSNPKIEKSINLQPQNKVNVKTGLENPIEKTLSNYRNSIQKDDNSVKISNTKIKNLNSEAKTNNPLSDIVTSKDENVKSNKEINIKELGKSETKIKVTSNQKFTSISSNKNDLKEKVVLNELLETTNVKEIKVDVQKLSKTFNNTVQKIQTEANPSVKIGKLNTAQSQSPIINSELKKVLSSKPELKQQTASKNFNTDNVNSEKITTNIIKEVSANIKTDILSKVSDTSNVNNTPKIQAQQEFFVDADLVDNEQTVSQKSAPIKIVNIDQKNFIENIFAKTDDKIISEKNSLRQNKTEEIETTKVKLEENINPITKKIILPELKSELKTVDAIKKDQVIEVEKAELGDENNFKESTKGNIKEAVIEISKKDLTAEVKVDQKNSDPKSTSKIIDKSNKNALNDKSVKENISVKINSGETTNTTTKLNSKTEPSSTYNSEKAFNVKDKSIIETLRSGLKEFANDQVKQESVNKDQNLFENKNTKVDFMQRRVYSHIPPLEVIAEESKTVSIKNSIVNSELNKSENILNIDETVKSVPNQVELKPKNEKQVWVKVSLEKNNNEVIADIKKSSQQPNKITIDTNNDGMKNNSEQNHFSEKDHRDYSKSKTQALSIEASQNTEVKNATQNHTTAPQQDLTANLKTEFKIENTGFKSVVHSEETKFSSRTSEMIEKVKVISAGEMIREVNKIFESGDKQSIVLRLVPKELGSVKVMLDTIDNVLNAKVEVENETVGQIVRNNVDQLKQNLLQSGVHLNSINISYHNSDQKQHGFNNHKRKNSVYEQSIETEDIDESIIAKKMGYNTYEYLA
ncbi:MAG: flagellar hook-length control protein FliK [Ignavibacteriales bacterium]|nr:flagellar hook-length control protein FliK [Ignavibacteriales bacterium]